jgi:modification methylase
MTFRYNRASFIMSLLPDWSKKESAQSAQADLATDLTEFVPSGIFPLENPQTDIPRIARDLKLTQLIEAAVQRIPTTHVLNLGDARAMSGLSPASVDLVITSPPYWTLKEYRDSRGQMGHIDDYDKFLAELDKVWTHCFRALVPGGRLICVVGDVCLSRRKNYGRHTVVPLHASIQERCRKLGFDNLAPIIWHKIANAAYEVDNGGGFLGKPYEPNSVIKNDIEFILMERKPGGYRTPDLATRVLSVISAQNHKDWFQQIWSGITGASTRYHPAPYPTELAARLIRMFSFVGDTVLDPFLGSGTTAVAAAKAGRNSVGFEVDDHYFELAHKRIAEETSSLFTTATIQVHRMNDDK